MATVTIEGSRVTPSTFLAPGKRKTVEYTPRVAKMIRAGYVDIVVEDVAPAPVARLSPNAQTFVQETRQITMPPKRSATKAEWMGFLFEHRIAHPADATKNDLIARWEAAVGAQAVPDEFVSDGSE